MSSRRLIRVLLIGAIIGITVATVILFVKSHKPTAAQIAEGQAQFGKGMKACLRGDFGGPRQGSDVTIQEFCEQNVNLADYIQGDRYALVGLPDQLLGTSFLVIVMALVIGASSIGAEWEAGTVTTLLAWEPRRARVLLMRLLVVAITVALIAFFLEAILGSVLSLVAATRGSTAGTGGLGTAWFHDVWAATLRIIVIAVVASGIGLALATIGRRTVAALGVTFVYLALFESLLHGLRPSISSWLLGVNVATYLQGRPTEIQLSDFQKSIFIGPTHGLLIACAYAAGLVVIALLLFRARDVN
ncbi:MAG: ABC transporter permease [Actinomycetota bacterium]|nr:ABC transporter permease [Actinomycetota bacterium]